MAQGPFEHDRRLPQNTRILNVDEESSFATSNFSASSSIRTTDTLLRVEGPTSPKRKSFFGRRCSSLFGNVTTAVVNGRSSFSRNKSESSHQSSELNRQGDGSETSTSARSFGRLNVAGRFSVSFGRTAKFSRGNSFVLKDIEYKSPKDISLIRRSSVVLKPTPNIDQSGGLRKLSPNIDQSGGSRKPPPKIIERSPVLFNDKGCDVGCDKEYVRRIQEGLQASRSSPPSKTSASAEMAPMHDDPKNLRHSDITSGSCSTSAERQYIIDIYRKGKEASDEIIRSQINPNYVEVKKNVVNRVRNLSSELDWLDHSEIYENDLIV